MNRPSTPPEADKLREAALDVFVYAPIGLLFEAREVLPRLAQRGRNQVALVKLFGRYAVQRGQAEADRILKARRASSSTAADERSRPTPPDTGAETEPSSANEPTDATETTRAPKPSASTRAAAPAASESRGVDDERDEGSFGEVLPDDAVEVVIESAALAIPGYDTLSASQVVPRLDALRPDELEAVRQYEAAHRGRRTILNRIAQLQGR